MTDQSKHQTLIELGQRIRAKRELRGLNLHELARLSGISPSALSLIETGKRDLRITSLYKVADALKVRVSDLVEPQISASTAKEREGEAGYDLGDYT